MAKGAPDYSKITLIKGAAPDGSLVTIAVDASGQILAVLKGDYLGTPTTIAVDANGHMLANIYDPSDLFGSTGYIGLAELAARLGSPMIFDRRGQLAWYDDFEASSLKWIPLLSGTGSAITLDNTVAFMKAQSVKLIAGTTTGMLADIGKYFPYIEQKRMGIEFTVCLDDTNPPTTVQLFIEQFTSTLRRSARLKWDVANADLLLFNDSGAYTTIDSFYPQVSGPGTWHKFKVVIDLETGFYVRVLYGNVEYDARAIQCYSAASAGNAYMSISIRNVGASGVLKTCWIDDVIITTNEP